MFVSAATGVKTIDDAKKKLLAIGSSGASSPSVLYPQVSNNLFGTKFKIVSGYSSGGDINLAVERREVDGRGSDSWASLKAIRPDWLRDRTINVLFQAGPRREIDLPDVPLWSELGQNDEQRLVLEVLSGDVAVGRPILTAPDVPIDRVKALRKAFDDTLKDPRFIAAAKQTNIYINPMSGEELQQIVRKVAGLSPKVIAMVKEAIKTKDLQEWPAGQKPKGDSSGGKE
jgi:tripartite-type tricarboxylate transporter receptor subunit TctC